MNEMDVVHGNPVCPQTLLSFIECRLNTRLLYIMFDILAVRKSKVEALRFDSSAFKEAVSALKTYVLRVIGLGRVLSTVERVHMYKFRCPFQVTIKSDYHGNSDMVVARAYMISFFVSFVHYVTCFSFFLFFCFFLFGVTPTHPNFVPALHRRLDRRCLPFLILSLSVHPLFRRIPQFPKLSLSEVHDPLKVFLTSSLEPRK